MNRQSLLRPFDGCGGARRRGAHVQSNFMCCPPRFSQDLFFCMRYVRKRSYFSLLLAFRTIRRTRRKFQRVPSLCFCCPLHGLLFHCRTRQFVLQCVTGVHGALDRRHHRCESGTRSSTRCCSRALAVIRLQMDVPVPQIPNKIVEVILGLWFACKGTSDSTGGRAHKPGAEC